MMRNEKRLIDANALIARFREIADIEWNHRVSPVCWADAYEKICDDVEDAPTVDAVEVPCRCKDCKHWKYFAHVDCTDFVKVCGLANYMIGATGYCLYGERKDNV